MAKRKARIVPQERWPDIPVALVVPVDPVTHQARRFVRAPQAPARAVRVNEYGEQPHWGIHDDLGGWKCSGCQAMYDTKRDAALCAEGHG